MVRTRFAPSPTGLLHIGGIRTALYCYAMAKKNDGKYLVRVEDTDQTRKVEGAVDEIFEMLSAYKIEPDESAKHGGEFGPYIQSERLEMYKKYAEELIERGGAYYCFLTPEEEEAIKTANREEHKVFRSPYRNGSVEDAKKLIAEGKPYTIRQLIPLNRELEIPDGVQGTMHVNTNDVDDGVLLKTDGFPTYHLAMLVDDHFMEISHVFRAMEWLPSSPKHLLLYETMGWEMPKMFHLSAILDPEGGKLSKRKGSVAAREFLSEGYLAEAVLNFLMLLGWSSPEERVHGEKEREFYSLQEFVDLFDVKDLNKSNPAFNREKLLWFNQQYIAKSTETELAEKINEWLNSFGADVEIKNHLQTDFENGLLADKLLLVKDRAKTLREIVDSLKFFYVKPEAIDWEIKQLENVRNLIDDIKPEIFSFLSGLGADAKNWDQEEWQMGMRAIGDKYQAKHGDVFMILRMCVVGGPFSPPLFEALQILGKEEVLSRINP